MELPEYTLVHTYAGTGEICTFPKKQKNGKKMVKPRVIIRDPKTRNQVRFGTHNTNRIFVSIPEKEGNRLWVLKPSEATKLTVPLPVDSEFTCVCGSTAKVSIGLE